MVGLDDGWGDKKHWEKREWSSCWVSWAAQSVMALVLRAPKWDLVVLGTMSCASEGIEITLCVWQCFWAIAIRLWGTLSKFCLNVSVVCGDSGFLPNFSPQLKIAGARGGWGFGKTLLLGQGTVITLYWSRACDTLLSTQLSAGNTKLYGLPFTVTMWAIIYLVQSGTDSTRGVQETFFKLHLKR